MKKLFFISIAVSGTFMVSGCGGPKIPTQVESPQMMNELANAPKWVLDPSVEGGIASVGSAKIGGAGMQFARTEALANGRDEIARQISVKVKNLVKNFTQVTGIGDDQVVDKVSSQVSKQVSSQVLNGSKQKDLWISPGNELFIFVVVDPNVVKESIKNSVNTSYKNEKALWQQFQAKKAQDELDKEIDKEFGGK